MKVRSVFSAFFQVGTDRLPSKFLFRRADGDFVHCDVFKLFDGVGDSAGDAVGGDFHCVVKCLDACRAFGITA